MRGAEALREMRLSGYAPSLVIIDLDDERLRMAVDWQHVNPTTARLAPAANDAPHRTDLRCVVGLKVFVHGDKTEAVHAWRDACIAAKASRVISAVTICTSDVPDYETFKTLEIGDTTGKLTWQNS